MGKQKDDSITLNRYQVKGSKEEHNLVIISYLIVVYALTLIYVRHNKSKIIEYD